MNNVNTVEQFIEKIQRLSELTVMTQEIYLYTEYFHKPNTSAELELYKDKVHGPHLRFIGHILYRNLIIELHKLFNVSKNDKLNILGIINEANKLGLTNSIKLDLQILKQFEERINNENACLEVIRTLRNKIYAHTDIIQIEDFELDISFKEINKLIDIAKEVVQYLYLAFLNSSFIFYPLNFERDRFILFETLLRGEKERFKEIVEGLGLTIRKE
jgi:hypothetical protein